MTFMEKVELSKKLIKEAVKSKMVLIDDKEK
jgi:hypothetical protein